MQYSEEELRAMLGKEEGISLILNISSADISGFGTRGGGNSDDFEQATLSTEKINSLRIIIVDKQRGSKTENKVIHNYYTGNLGYARFGLAGIRFDNLNFSSKYRIYLIANENGLPEDVCKKFKIDINDPSQGLPPGAPYPADQLENIEISNMVDITAGKALINNESSYLSGGIDEKPIPMTEIFDITTDPRPDTYAEDIKHYMERNFFITRAASKFSFRFKSEQEISDKDLKIKSVKIYGLATKEYLFPKDTKYIQNDKVYITTDPTQDYSSLNPDEGMEVSEFNVPDPSDNTSTFTFDLSKIISGIGSEGIYYNPQIYFPESKGKPVSDGKNEFQCEITLGKDGDASIISSGPITLPNLDALPRNTHVLINVTFHEIGFQISVDKWPVGIRTEIEMKQTHQ